MLTKGTKDVKWTEGVFEGTDKPTPEGEKHWYEKTNFHDLGIVYCERPKGKSVKINFWAHAGLGDKALEIREAAPYKFKHTGDVNRNAHYIGMYILEQLFVKNKRNTEEENVFREALKMSEGVRRQENLREIFVKFFDGYVSGLTSYEDLLEIISTISGQIKDKELKKWFEQDCEKILGNDLAFNKTKHKLKVAEGRSRGMLMISEK
jgi:hypothetical protein